MGSEVGSEEGTDAEILVTGIDVDVVAVCTFPCNVSTARQTGAHHTLI